MTQALVQTAVEIVVSSGTAGSVTLNGVAAGDLLTASAVIQTTGVTLSASDNQGNAWHAAVNAGSPYNIHTAVILYAANAAGGNTAVTVTASASTSFRALVQEWSGSATSSPLAATDFVVESAAATSHVSSATGINPGGACLCLVAAGTGSNLGTVTPGAGYTGEPSSFSGYFYEYKVFGSAPANEHGAYTSQSARTCVQVIAAFSAAAASGPGAFIGGGMGSFIGG